MSRFHKTLFLSLGAMLLLAASSTSLSAQGKSKHYAVSSDRAVTVTREVLVKQGYEVVRVEREGDAQVIYYRRGNNGRGRGKGRLERMVVRREAERIVFVDTPQAILVDIDIRLKL
jgi:hypothetical protein